MIDVLAAWLIGQAAKLVLVPVAQAARDEFANQVGASVGGAAAGIVTGWVGKLTSGSTDDAQQVVREMDANPREAVGLQQRLEDGLHVKLAGRGEDDGQDRSVDAFLVSAYEATLWRIAMTALWEDARPIAIRGALQGPEWLTVCAPSHDTRTGGLSGHRPDALEPASIWQRRGTNLDRGLFEPPVEFFVRRAGEEGDRDVDQLNRAFRREPESGFRPAQDGPLEERWHRVDGVRSIWLQLQPDSDAEFQIRRNRAPYETLDVSPPAYSEYPESWHPLIDIPDESAGLQALNAGADGFAEDNQRLRQRAEDVIGGNHQPPPSMAS